MDSWKKYLFGGYLGIIICTVSIVLILTLTWIFVPSIYFLVFLYYTLPALGIIVLSIVDIKYALRQKKQNPDKYTFPRSDIYNRSGLNITEKRIKKWIKKGWMDGLGTKLNPFKFADSTKVPEFLNIKIKNTKSYILVKNCVVNELTVEYSDNLIIESNTILSLVLSYCSNAYILVNKINSLILDCSTANFIRYNELPEQNLNALMKNKYPFPYVDVVPSIIIILFATFLYVGSGILTGWVLPLFANISLILIIAFFCYLPIRKWRVIKSLKLYKKAYAQANVIEQNFIKNSLM